MKIFFNLVFITLSVVFLFYVALPTPSFPNALPSGSLQSEEPGDIEDFKNRRAYFTDQAREEVIEFHKDYLENVYFYGYTIPLPTYRLNYRPEDAMIYIKDLTRSWYLEEIVHPFRETFFVNGFVLQSEKDTIIIEGRHFEQKITVRYYKSEIWFRVGLALLSIVVTYLLIREWGRTLFLKND